MFTELSPIYRTSGAIPIGGVRLDVIADCDVLVVGAGTSGMPAAVVAARRGHHCRRKVW
jgi:NADPH-dependent 2,4-dienoyl-CoA reductase/sulfur reductase-like enzyme